MTPHHRLLLLVLAAALGGCVPTQRAIHGHARGSETWSWRMSATEGRWSGDADRAVGARSTPARPVVEPEREPAATAVEPAAADDAEMTLEPDHVAPAVKPKALVASAKAKATTKRPARTEVELESNDSDEEFVNKIIDDNADAEDGEITMAAMPLPKTKAERAAAKKKLSAPVADIDPEPAAKAPAKKKHMTRAEKRRAKLMAKLEKKKAKEMAAREARLRGQRARIDEEERERASKARKARRSKHKGKFFKNGEGFIDDDEEAADDDSDDQEAAASDEDGDDDADSDDDEGGDDESDDDDGSVVVVTSKKKATPAAAPARPAASKPAASKPAPKGKVARVKSDWRGQAVDDEDPLKSQKKK